MAIVIVHNGCRCLSGLHLADIVGKSIGTLLCRGHNKRLLLGQPITLLRPADKRIVNIQVYFCEATDSHTERIALSFEHNPFRLCF